MDASRYDLAIRQGGSFSKTLLITTGPQWDIESFADAGGGSVTVNTLAAHGKSNGDRVVIAAYDEDAGINYSGAYTVADAAATSFTIVADWQGTCTGFWARPKDLTNKTFAGEIKRNAKDTDTLGSLTTDATVDPTGGVLTISLTSVQTAAMPTFKKGAYELEMTDTVIANLVDPLLYGDVTVST